jgi:hypothetical protein
VFDKIVCSVKTTGQHLVDERVDLLLLVFPKRLTKSAKGRGTMTNVQSPVCDAWFCGGRLEQIR